MGTTFIYIDEYTDEVLPCVPSLEGWAEWLGRDVREEWGREGPTACGAEFNAGRLTDLGTVRVIADGEGGWSVMGPIPEGTDTYYLRDGNSGWDADFGGDTIEDALTDLEGDEALVACVRTDSDVRVRFNSCDGTPRLTIVGGAR